MTATNPNLRLAHSRDLPQPDLLRDQPPLSRAEFEALRSQFKLGKYCKALRLKCQRDGGDYADWLRQAGMNEVEAQDYIQTFDMYCAITRIFNELKRTGAPADFLWKRACFLHSIGKTHDEIRKEIKDLLGE